MKKIKLEIYDNEKGLQIVSIFNRTITAYKTHRFHLKELLNRNELESPGIYLLIGIDEEEYRTTIYIGESEDINKRIPQHSNKEYWNQCIVFRSQELNKAHVRWLEGAIYDDLETAGQVILMNENKPSISRLSEADEVAMYEFKTDIYRILGVLGFVGINESPEIPEDKKSLMDYEFELVRHNEILAKMRPVATGYMVLKDSLILSGNVDRSSVFMKSVSNLKDSLREKGIIVKNNEGMEVLTKSQIFPSPSRAAKFILDYPVNGLKAWKTKDGNPLKEIEEMLTKS